MMIFEELDVNITDGLEYLNVTNLDGDVYNPEKDADSYLDFDEAVAAISENDNGIEM